MKKIILAFVALGFAFAISSCCDQSYCPQNMKCNDADMRPGRKQEETPYRWDTQTERKHQEQQQERQRRRW